MLSSTGGEENNSKRHNRASSSPSRSTSSASSSSSPSPFSPSFHLGTPRSKTMEEVWKDITLSSLHDHTSREDLSETPINTHPPPHANFRGMILQDFLDRPPSKDPPPSSAVHAGGRLFGSPVPPPATVLSLNTAVEFHFLDISDPLKPHSHSQSHPIIPNVPSFNGPFDALANSSSGKKRYPESENNSCDRRHKRMIKNRESAARSRARKQAYTNELEQEVSYLMEENERLRKQQTESCGPLRISAPAQLSKKQTLQRTSTAPF